MARRKRKHSRRHGHKRAGHAAARCKTTKTGKLIKSTCHRVRRKRK